MRDTHFRLPADLRDRRVFRAPGKPGTQPFPGLHGCFDSLQFDDIYYGSNGLKSTAHDLAAFLQMLAGRGSLWRAAIAEPGERRRDHAPPGQRSHSLDL